MFTFGNPMDINLNYVTSWGLQRLPFPVEHPDLPLVTLLGLKWNPPIIWKGLTTGYAVKSGMQLWLYCNLNLTLNAWPVTNNQEERQQKTPTKGNSIHLKEGWKLLKCQGLTFIQVSFSFHFRFFILSTSVKLDWNHLKRKLNLFL